MNRLPLTQLRIGTTLRSPIYTSESRPVLLLAEGTTITSEHLRSLAARGIEEVLASPSEIQRILNAPRPASSPATPGKATPQNRYRAIGRLDSFDPDLVRKLARSCEASLQQNDTLFCELRSGRRVDGGALDARAAEGLSQMSQDFDLYVGLGIRAETDRYPSQHCQQTSMLATAIAATLGHSESDLRELNVGCLLHDAGMTMIDPGISSQQRRLTDGEFLEITKHPTKVFERVCDNGTIGQAARMVVYQMHERCDGSGYPRRAVGSRIHPLAKVAAIADVYLALVSPRPHRPGLMPYHAVEKMVRAANDGQFDPAAIRGLLKTISLFPIGSYVEASDGRVGRVVRANIEKFNAPVVELWSPHDPATPVEIVDLSQSESLQVVRALPDLPNRPQATSGGGSIDEASIEDNWE